MRHVALKVILTVVLKPLITFIVESQSFQVNKSIIHKDIVAGHVPPKFSTVFHSVMYVPPTRGSLTFAKNAVIPRYMEFTQVSYSMLYVNNITSSINGASPDSLIMLGVSHTISTAQTENNKRNGMNFMYVSVGRGPVVYLVTINGRNISVGIIDSMIRMSKLSFFMPASSNFNFTTLSHRAKANFDVNNINTNNFTPRNFRISNSTLYDLIKLKLDSSVSDVVVSSGGRSCLKIAIKIVAHRKHKPQDHMKPFEEIGG